MQQRVGLARALAADPEILLMDEAFSALDPLIRSQLQDDLLAIQERLGKTIVFVSHDLDEAMKIGNRIAIMRDGMVIQVGTPAEIISAPADDYVRAFVHGADRRHVLTAAQIMTPTGATGGPDDRPADLLHKIEGNVHDGLAMMDRERRLQGYATKRDVCDLDAGRGSIRNIVRPVPSVSPDTPVADLIKRITQEGAPLMVVGSEHELLGIISKNTLLAALSHAADAADADGGDAGSTGPGSTNPQSRPVDRREVDDGVV